jgi:hypothetical protein
MGAVIQKLFGPPGDPEPGVPFAEAVARKLGLNDPMGKTSYFAQFKSSYPANPNDRTGSIYPMLSEEMVSRIAEK